MKNGEKCDITLMLQAVEFIEAGLQEDITVADIAESVSFSLFHFSRIFSRVTRHAPYDYLMRRRLCEAARRLLETDAKIIEIAFDYQFNAPETFSRAFKRVFHIQPRQARQQKGFDQRLVMPRPTREYLEFIDSGVSLKPTAVKFPALEVTGIAALINTRDADGEVLAVWDLLEQELQSSELSGANRDYVGVRIAATVPDKPAMYLAGTVLEAGEEAPLSFVQKSIPSMDAASFELPQQPQAVLFTRQYAYHTWWSKATSAPPPRLEVERFKDPPGRWNPHSLSLPLPIK